MHGVLICDIPKRWWCSIEGWGSSTRETRCWQLSICGQPLHPGGKTECCYPALFSCTPTIARQMHYDRSSAFRPPCRICETTTTDSASFSYRLAPEYKLRALVRSGQCEQKPLMAQQLGHDGEPMWSCTNVEQWGQAKHLSMLAYGLYEPARSM